VPSSRPARQRRWLARYRTWPWRVRTSQGNSQPRPSGNQRICVGIGSGGPPVVEICGEIDIFVRPAAAGELLWVIRRHGPQLALDLGGVTFLDCAGINALLATRRRARLEDGWVRVIRASPPARRTISLRALQEASALT
jgi:anti-anti-sigma factor